jgi:hypothetical protein
MRIVWLLVFAFCGVTMRTIGMMPPALAETEVDIAVVTMTETPELELTPVLQPQLVYPSELAWIVSDVKYRENLIRCVNDAAHEYGVDPWLIWSVIKYESTYHHLNAKAEVKRGGSREVGVAQIMLYWSKKWGYNLFDVRDNIRCCARLLQYARDELGLTDTQEILGWYNTGKEIVNQYAWRGHRQYHTWLAKGG